MILHNKNIKNIILVSMTLMSFLACSNGENIMNMLSGNGDSNDNYNYTNQVDVTQRKNDLELRSLELRSLEKEMEEQQKLKELDNYNNKNHKEKSYNASGHEYIKGVYKKKYNEFNERVNNMVKDYEKEIDRYANLTIISYIIGIAGLTYTLYLIGLSSNLYNQLYVSIATLFFVLIGGFYCWQKGKQSDSYMRAIEDVRMDFRSKYNELQLGYICKD